MKFINWRKSCYSFHNPKLLSSKNNSAEKDDWGNSTLDRRKGKCNANDEDDEHKNKKIDNSDSIINDSNSVKDNEI